MLNILYIDDDKFDHLTLKRIVASFKDIEVDYAFGLKEAQALLDSNEYDTVISDVYLGNEKVGWSDLNTEIYYVSGSQKALNDIQASGIDSGYCFLKPLSKEAFKVITEYLLTVKPDYSIVEEIAEGDVDFETELKSIFISEIPQQIQKTAEAFSVKDYNQIASLVHAMQTKIRTFGLSGIEELAESIENDARSQINLDNFEERLDRLYSMLFSAIKNIKRGVQNEMSDH